MAEQKKMKLNYKLTFLIGFGFMASSIAWSVYNAYVPPILDEMLSASPTVAGIAEKLPWLATLFGGTDVVGAGVVGGLIGAIMVIDNVFGVIFQPLFGKISDRTHSRLGKRRPYLLFGIPAAALFFILIPRMPYIWTLMLCVICFNLIMSLWRSPVVALMPDLTPPSLRSEGNAVINLMGGLGTLLGMGSGMIVIAIMTLFMGSKPATDAERPYVFIFTAVVMLICLLVVMLTVKEPDSRLKKTAEANMAAEAKREEKQKLKDLKLPKEKKRSLVFMLLTLFFLFNGSDTIQTFFTLFAKKELGIDTATATILMGVFALSLMIFAIPAGKLGQKIGRKKTILIGLGGALLLFTLFFLTKEMPSFQKVMIFIALIGGGACVALVNINTLPVVLDPVRYALWLDELLVSLYLLPDCVRSCLPVHDAGAPWRSGSQCAGAGCRAGGLSSFLSAYKGGYCKMPCVLQYPSVCRKRITDWPKGAKAIEKFFGDHFYICIYKLLSS